MLDSPKAPRTAAPTNFDALHMPRSYLWTMLLGRTGVRTLQQRCAKVPAGNPGSWKSVEIPIKSTVSCWNGLCGSNMYLHQTHQTWIAPWILQDIWVPKPNLIKSLHQHLDRQISTSTSGPKAISCRTLKLNICCSMSHLNLGPLGGQQPS